MTQNSSFTVIKPGMFTTIQDLGRQKQTGLGLSQGGPIDEQAFFWCNRILGNEANTAGLEITFGGLTIQVSSASQICLTGANSQLFVNGVAQPSWQTVDVPANSIVDVTMARNGLRSYLNFIGGIAEPAMFGSCATVVREQLGPNNGRALSKGDVISFKSLEQPMAARKLAEVPVYHQSVELRVVLGYQQNWFSNQAKQRFFSEEYAVTPQFDRMGYRLNGAPIQCDRNNMLSEGIALGAIQIPADGQPIILLNDRQTLGGYPKLGSVCSVDLPKLAQCGAGATLCFTPIEPDQARELLLAEQQKRQQTELLVNL